MTVRIERLQWPIIQIGRVGQKRKVNKNQIRKNYLQGKKDRESEKKEKEMNKAYSLAKKTSLNNRAQKIIGEHQKRLENFKTERKSSPSEKIKKRKNEKKT